MSSHISPTQNIFLIEMSWFMQWTVLDFQHLQRHFDNIIGGEKDTAVKVNMVT